MWVFTKWIFVFIFQNGYCIFRASAQMMIQMMDRNRNGKLDKRNEASMLDIDELMKNDEVDSVRAYVPDLDKLVKKVSFVFFAAQFSCSMIKSIRLSFI